MKNKGKILSMDIYAQKLEELKRRAKRAGAENIEIRLIESSKTVKRMKGTADRVLIDAPCSGLGVLRRNPDIKWRFSSEELEKMHSLQEQLLRQFAVLLKPGGKLVYATCSILPSENESRVQQFLDANPGFALEKEERLYPHIHGCDGFYMARIVRKE
jgi:16S rRNA (cytosine967-C5)-methyltransferase